MYSLPISATLAALTIASAASTDPMKPFVSMSPRASCAMDRATVTQSRCLTQKEGRPAWLRLIGLLCSISVSQMKVLGISVLALVCLTTLAAPARAGLAYPDNGNILASAPEPGAAPYADLIASLSAEHGVPADLVHAV